MKTNYFALLFALLLAITTTPATYADVVLDPTLMTDNCYAPYSGNTDATSWLYGWDDCEGSPFYGLENGNQADDQQEAAYWWPSNKGNKNGKFICPPHSQVINPEPTTATPLTALAQ